MTVCRNPDGEADYVMHKIEQLVRQKDIDIGILLFFPEMLQNMHLRLNERLQS